MLIYVSILSGWVLGSAATEKKNNPETFCRIVLCFYSYTSTLFRVDKENGIRPGFGATINIINGGLECNTKDGKESNQALNRWGYGFVIGGIIQGGGSNPRQWCEWRARKWFLAFHLNQMFTEFESYTLAGSKCLKKKILFNKSLNIN